MPVQEDLWPEIPTVFKVSEPVQILKEQAEALRKKTNGILYGTVEESEIPPADGISYDFYVGVANKPYRYLLLSIQHGIYADYPVRITNTLITTTSQVEKDRFKENIRLTLRAPATIELLQRMMAFASEAGE